MIKVIFYSRPVVFQSNLCDKLNRKSIVVERVGDKKIINFDETGIQLCPAATRTFHQRGDHQVEIMGLDDKRQLTCGLAASMTGVRLNIQLIFAGTTNACHPTKKVQGVSYHHSKSHWQDVETTLAIFSNQKA